MWVCEYRYPGEPWKPEGFADGRVLSNTLLDRTRCNGFTDLAHWWRFVDANPIFVDIPVLYRLRRGDEVLGPFYQDRHTRFTDDARWNEATGYRALYQRGDGYARETWGSWIDRLLPNNVFASLEAARAWIRRSSSYPGSQLGRHYQILDPNWRIVWSSNPDDADIAGCLIDPTLDADLAPTTTQDPESDMPRAPRRSNRTAPSDQPTQTIIQLAPANAPQETPAMTAPASATPAPTPAPLAKVAIKRVGGKLMLTVDAKPLHDILDAIGVPTRAGVYLERPETSVAIASSDFKLSTEIFLKQGPQQYSLSGIWSSPPNISRLNDLVKTAKPVVRKILEHYQPVDITMSIHKSVVSGDSK